jgi:autotransporter passenger strand-loop-strand repeat protein
MATTSVTSGVTSSGFQVTSGSELEVLSGGTALVTVVSSGGTEQVDAGGIASGTIVSNGGSETVFGMETGGTVLSGGFAVDSGGSASRETISSGGTATISAGGMADNIIVSSGGTLKVLGTIFFDVTVYSGGTETVLLGGITNSTTVSSGGSLVLSAFGLVIGRARRPLMAFVMVLSYSRQIFLRFFLDARTECFRFFKSLHRLRVLLGMLRARLIRSCSPSNTFINP